MKIIKIIWQLPQFILAHILIKIYGYDRHFEYEDKTVYISSKFYSGISLGEIIILRNYNTNAIKHEYGHSRQSMYLGALYLILVGIPSLTFNLLSMIKPDGKFAKNYYMRYPENWADKLGKVER